MNICRIFVSKTVDSLNIKCYITKLLHMKIPTVGASTHPGRNISMKFSKPLVCAVSIHCQV